MRYLLDSHVLLWMLSSHQQLSAKAKKILKEEGSELFFSVAGIWEIGLKYSLNKLTLPSEPRKYLPERLAEARIEGVPISQSHVLRVNELSYHHRDPFDRIMAAQALEDSFTIISSDDIFDRYGVERVW